MRPANCPMTRSDIERVVANGNMTVTRTGSVGQPLAGSSTGKGASWHVNSLVPLIVVHADAWAVGHRGIQRQNSPGFSPGDVFAIKNDHTLIRFVTKT